jgi:hypothetical protein
VEIMPEERSVKFFNSIPRKKKVCWKNKKEMAGVENDLKKISVRG